MLPIVLVHGLIGPLSDPRALDELRPAVVVSPDLVGYGANAGLDVDGLTVEGQSVSLRSALDRAQVDGPVHLVGHSVGWVIVASFARRHPRRVGYLVNIEGNFSLDDAFWSRKLAAMDAAHVQRILDGDRADPVGWLRRMGIEPTQQRLRSAIEALRFQPAATVHAMARCVVDHTARPEYGRSVQRLFDTMPVHLVAGARSREGWHVPAWALEAATGYTEIPGVGHMIMLEEPEALGATLRLLLTRRGPPVE